MTELTGLGEMDAGCVVEWLKFLIVRLHGVKRSMPHTSVPTQSVSPSRSRQLTKLQLSELGFESSCARRSKVSVMGS